MDILMWGPSYDYERSYREEQIRSMWGRPSRRHGVHRAGRRAARRAERRASGHGRALPGSGAWPAA